MSVLVMDRRSDQMDGRRAEMFAFECIGYPDRRALFSHKLWISISIWVAPGPSTCEATGHQ